MKVGCNNIGWGSSGSGGSSSSTWAEILANGAETSGTSPIITGGDALIFDSALSSYKGSLVVGNITVSDKTWTLPNQTGTIALTSDITNIYTTDGTISVDRTVLLDDLSGSLTFENSSNEVIFSITYDGIFRLGFDSSPFDNTAVTIGYQATTSAKNSVAIGRGSAATECAVAIGYLSAVSGIYGIGIGKSATSSGDCVAIGISTQALVSRSVAIGQIAIASSQGVSIGYNVTTDDRGVAIGYSASSTGQGVAIGESSTATGNSVSIGASNTAIAGSSLVGTLNNTTGGGIIAIGAANTVSGNDSIGIGRRTASTGGVAFTIGTAYDNATNMTNAIDYSFAIGWGVINPHILLAKTADGYLNLSGNIWFGDGTATATEGAPSNLPASISKLTVKGNLEVVGDGSGSVGVVIEADDGSRVLMKVRQVGSSSNYVWDTGTVL